MSPRHVAVFDVGKTNAKVVVHDLETGADVFERRRPNVVLPGPPWPHFDNEGLWGFLVDTLRITAAEFAVDAVSVTTHGASIVVLDGDGVALPILDYEQPLAETAAEYAGLRPPFEETLSPPLPGGLNVGAQLHWLERARPDAFARVRTIITYPGYWGFRLTGRLGADVTSLGSHTDIWDPSRGAPSSLARARGWDRMIAPVGRPFDLLGGLRAEVAAATGLPEGLPVVHGIHDSNASLLPHLMSRPAPFAVLSTGTWAIAFAVGTAAPALDPSRDTLCNVDAFGRPVPSARFMAGREFDLLTAGRPETPTAEEIRRVIDAAAMALPSFVAGTGPFGGHKGRWTVDPASLAPGERTAAASLYAALVSEVSLSLIGAGGPTVVEGPFAANRLFCDALSQLTGRPVRRAAGTTGTSAGAALLALGPDVRRPVPPEVTGGEPIDLAGLDGYARVFRNALAAVGSVPD